MSFIDENERFESWLRRQCAVVEDDLKRKHKKMSRNSFSFLRATFFRWSSQIEGLCPDLKGAPVVLAVGDAHVENFGTWRDSEARLVWGVNDFDDAANIPYVFDLVRLATSVQLAPKSGAVGTDVSEAILKGYRNGIANPRPTLLDENETWMRAKVACSDDDRANFWKEIDGLPAAEPPSEIATALTASLPSDATHERFASRAKGGGSLGRPRFVAIADWRGGRIVREAKALVTSGWNFAHGDLAAPIQFLTVANGTFWSPDPFLKIESGFILRRVTADSRKADLDDGAGSMDMRLIEAMGFDLASVHAATSNAQAIVADLSARLSDWLAKAVEAAAGAVENDYAEWMNRKSK
jgi:hypothetical protein